MTVTGGRIMTIEYSTSIHIFTQQMLFTFSASNNLAFIPEFMRCVATIRIGVNKPVRQLIDECFTNVVLAI